MRDFKYIIKRIIIGVGITLALGFIRGNFLLGVKALTVSTVQVSDIDTSQGIDNTTRSIIFGTPSWNIWTNSSGYVLGTFSIKKVGSSPSPTASVISLRYVLAVSNNGSFSCNVGTTSLNNSTYTASTYTYVCPVSLGSSGLQYILVGFNGWQSNAPDDYTVEFNNNLTLYNEQPQINFDTSSTTTAIESMEQALIDNQEQQTESIIESNKVCNIIDKNYIVDDNKYLNSSGALGSSDSYGVTDYVRITKSTVRVLPVSSSSGSHYLCFYNSNKVRLSCVSVNPYTEGNTELTIPTGATYFRSTIVKSSNLPTYEVCTNGNQAVANNQQETNDLIKSDDVSGANSKASEFFNDFTAESHGLSGIVSAPLRLITSLSSSTCTSLTLPLPFVSQNAVLPCMSTVYSNFPTFLSLWQLISTGLIAYWIVIRLFYKVHEFQDPESDRIEVLDL